ncbi:GNAT family N-acetyltransferase [Chitinophaga nivalis]|uniref:GNAT family N-acetyltransferase n=1 Tax=Chitinophaga nivalis TaxID=2991709 RepID=A0ABT3IME0_9BACT|nr:GNAT family N-acetyltransferase [Chitinophaga nivalis]MCW3465185.1 GNAT family N-acetyltransferase [Chitinophaga nivalis]MCW3485123.1 GNAT family N-acetyltransferase [Chitinophaga nivalis]
MRIIYQSKTIIIREFLPAEVGLFTGLFEDEAVTRYLPPRSPEQYIGLFNIALEDYGKGLLSRWGIFNATNDDFIGICLGRDFVEVPGQLEIGYVLSQAYWGKNVGTEVCLALKHYLFDHTEVKEVVAVTAPDNIGSQKVLEKSGFKRAENLVREGDEIAYFIVQRPA